MLLSTDDLFADQAMRCLGESMIRVTSQLGLAGANKQFFVQCLVYGNDRIQGLVLNIRQLRCLACSLVGGCGDGEQGLPDKLHDLIRQYRVTGEHRADVEMARHILGSDYGDDTGVSADGLQIHGHYSGVGLLAVTDRGVQDAFRHG